MSAPSTRTGVERIRVLRIIARMNVGGPARQVTALAQGLDGDRFEHRVLVGVVGPGEVDFLQEQALDIGVRTITGLGRAVRPADDLRAYVSIIRELRAFRPHVVHTHTAKAGFLGRLAVLVSHPRRRGRPSLVHTFHGHLLKGYFPPRVTMAVTVLERWLARRTDLFVAVGARVRDELLAAGVGQRHQYRIVPPGIAWSSPPPRATARAALGIDGGGPVVVFVGRLAPVKRPDRFVDMAGRVLRQVPSAMFVVVGGGELEQDLRAQVVAAGLDNSVRLLGWRSDVELAYAASDVVVLTSDNEGTPVSLIEAALAGRPVVTTDVGSVAEVVVDGETGLVVEPDAAALAAAVVSLLVDDGIGRRFGAEARRRAEERFSAQRLVADTAKLYNELLGRPEASP